VLNSLASGRRLALRIILLQLAVAAIVGLAFLTQGRRDALAAAAGAAAVALGTALLAWRTFAGLGGGGMTMGRLLAGMVLKWIAILGGLVAILGQWKLPPLAAITGLVAAYAINLLAFRFKG
jgi:ATP synthase protein I